MIATHRCPQCGTSHRLPSEPTSADLRCRECDTPLVEVSLTESIDTAEESFIEEGS